jgi:nitrous oxide reductase accessory protein NosL
VPRTKYASLLDDPDFVARLDTLELTVPPEGVHPVAEWFVEPSSPRWSQPGDAAWLSIVGFFVMMGVGGAAAAYVFADRVAMILAR